MFFIGGPDLAQYAGKKHINRGRWTKEEDEKLKRLVEVHGERWDLLASHFPDRADVQCQHRWQKVVNPELVKGRIIIQFYRLYCIMMMRAGCGLSRCPESCSRGIAKLL